MDIVRFVFGIILSLLLFILFVENGYIFASITCCFYCSLSTQDVSDSLKFQNRGSFYMKIGFNKIRSLLVHQLKVTAIGFEGFGQCEILIFLSALALSNRSYKYSQCKYARPLRIFIHALFIL